MTMCHTFCDLLKLFSETLATYAPFTLDEGADMVLLPLKYFEKSQNICQIFILYSGIARALRWDCKSVEVGLQEC